MKPRKVARSWAAADEWVLVPRARVNGTTVRAAEVLVPGDFLEES